MKTLQVWLGWFGWGRFGVLPLFIALLSLSSCANNNFGYQDHAGGPHGEPLPRAYYPRRCLVNIGPIVFLDIQVVKRHKGNYIRDGTD